MVCQRPRSVRRSLDRDLADLARRNDVGGGVLEWGTCYLLLTARKR